MALSDLIVVDYAREALQLTRDEFAAKHPHPFFLSVTEPERPQRAVGTDVLQAKNVARLIESTSRDRANAPWVLPVKKTRPTFPGMITVGRTRNNDIVIEDALVSKFHAYLQTKQGQLELVDANSRNGTFVGDRRVEAKGEPARLKLGDRVRFGRIVLQYISPVACWDCLVRAQDHWG